MVDSYYYSEWQNTEDVSLDLLKGLDLRENIIKSLLPASSGSVTNLEQAVENKRQPTG